MHCQRLSLLMLLIGWNVLCLSAAAFPEVAYQDYFEDGIMDWTAIKGTWTETDGALTTLVEGKKSKVMAPYEGCGICTIDVDVRVDRDEAVVSLLAWHQDENNYVQLKIKKEEGNEKWSLKQVSGGSKLAKESGKQPGPTPGFNHHVTLTYSGSEFQVFIDGSTTPLITMQDGAPAFGTVGFKVKSNDGIAVVGSFDEMYVSVPTDPSLIVPLGVLPSATDPDINDINGYEHMVCIDPNGGQVGKLFVFFPGTGGPPAGYKWICKVAATRGYHAIGLVYKNEISVNGACAGSPDPACQEQMRLEIIDGTDRTPLVDVDRTNSIENRLIKLLEYLQTNRADEMWGQFLNAGQIRWESMTLAGHSQGGGHAAIIGKYHLVHRVALFSSTEPAAWTNGPPVTSPDRYYGLAHEKEGDFNAFVNSWENLQIPGIPTRVEDNSPPFGGSHQLTTMADPAGPLEDNGEPNWHGAVVVDPYTPLQPDGTTPLFQNAWIYMIDP